MLLRGVLFFGRLRFIIVISQKIFHFAIFVFTCLGIVVTASSGTGSRLVVRVVASAFVAVTALLVGEVVVHAQVEPEYVCV